MGRGIHKKINRYFTHLHLYRMRKRFMSSKPKTSGYEHFLGYTIRITDGPNYYMQYKDIFANRIYWFNATDPNPLILDCGSNIGMSIFYFKYIYPKSRIIGFEPDPDIFQILQENIAQNKIKDVTLINSALGEESGFTQFLPDGSAGGLLNNGEDTISVKVEPISNYLVEPVDFLKLNIEGQELEVLKEAESRGRLHNVSEMVLEYHGWADGEQRLGEILSLLERQGFRYLVHDFDSETCGTSKPPFCLTSKTTWFCLVYAKRL